jgi:HK97 family phage major capsid protein
MNTAQLERDFEAKRAAAARVHAKHAATAQEENRVFTPEERAEITTLRDEALAAHTKLADAKGDADLLSELDRLATLAKSPSGGGGGKVTRAMSLGDQYLASPAYDFHRKGGHRSQSAWRSPSAEIMAATLTTDPASGGALITPEYQAGILQQPQVPIMVPQLFAQGTTNSNLIVFMREKTWTNAAAPVKEGTAKPESTLIFDSANAPVRKIAHWLPVTEEMLEDEPAIRSYIDARLRLGVTQEEEDQVLNGGGVDPELLGIMNTPGLAAPVAAGTESTFDAFFLQQMQIYASSYLMPDAHVMHPMDWAGALLSKDSQGRYFVPGPFSPVQSPSMWGLPVVVTPKMPQGTGLTGAFKMGGQIFRRGGIRVETSNSHQDFFVKNLVAIRAEERLALAIYRPGAFGKVTGLIAAPGGLSGRESAREARE